MNITHRDIKPENILIDSMDEIYIKLTDFGFASFFDKETEFNQVLGSPIYMPPEIVKHQKYDCKVDVWSAGVVAYVLLSGTPPFIGDSKDLVYEAIKNQDLDFSKSGWSKVSESAKDFLT